MKKCILLLLLVTVAFVAISQRKSFYEEREYYAINFFDDTYNLLANDNSSADQIFIAKQSELKTIHIKFDITNLVDLSGFLQLSILDSEDNIVSTKLKKLRDLTQTESSQWTKFNMDAELEKGQTYTLHIIVQKAAAESDGTLNLCLASNKQGLFKDLYLDGEKSSKRMVATFKYNTYCIDDFQTMMVLLFLTAVMVLLSGLELPRKIYRKLYVTLCKKRQKKIRWAPAHLPRINEGLLLLILTPLVSDYMVQRFCGYHVGDFAEQLLSMAGVLNLVIYIAITLILFVIMGNSRYAAALTMVITFVAGLMNYFVWSFRDCPIVAADIASIQTAANVAGGYDYSTGFNGTWGLVIFVIFLSLLFLFPGYKMKNLKRRIALGILSVLMATGIWGLIFKSDYLGEHDIFVSVWMPQRNYAQNGCALSFLLTCSYYIVEKPSDYSPDAVEAITENYTSDESTELTLEQTPNIIAIMNESFSDLAVDADIETSEDYMPFIHNLTENTIKGNLYVSVLGGNTANSEFEFLTGNTLAFFPSRSVPYNSYLRNMTGSLTWNLRNSGYKESHALHPYYSNGWSREIVYPLLGFTDFITQDQFSAPRLVREFISDEADFKKLIEEYETLRKTSDAPFYDFNVTMQNHGGYSGTHGLITEKLKVLNPANANDQLVQYMNLMKETDTAFQDLVKYFENVDEPTVIIMFGDHQPGFTDSVYDALMGQDTDTLSTEDTAKMYITPYIIWANYDISANVSSGNLPGTPGMDMSANYLSSYIMKLLDLPMTGYNKYLLELMEKVPVISGVCYIGDDGVVHTPSEESEYSELIREYQMIQYNNMFDVDNRIDEFFYLKDSDLTIKEFEHSSAPPS